jgi:hypothetical protein
MEWILLARLFSFVQHGARWLAAPTDAKRLLCTFSLPIALAVALLGPGACGGDEAPAGATDGSSSTSGPVSFGNLASSDDPEPTSTSTGTADTTGTSDTPDTGSSSTAAEPFCGDGQLDPPEECDLGIDNSDAGYCTNTCQIAACGDGLVWIGVETCDEGYANNNLYGGCTPQCQWGPRCGDGHVAPVHEECDAGDANGREPVKENETYCTEFCHWFGRLVFLSSASYTGDLGGLDGADLQCQILAAGVGLDMDKKFRAWLSGGFESPANRFELTALSGTPYVMLNGKIVAASFAELVDDGPRTGISITETGQASFHQFVWSNTSPLGTPHDPTQHCQSWTTSDGSLSARQGVNALAIEEGPAWQAWQSERQWTSALSSKCEELARLYCFEDAP